MSFQNKKGYPDYQTIQPMLNDFMTCDLVNEFVRGSHYRLTCCFNELFQQESLPPQAIEQLDTSRILNIAELRESIRLTEHQLVKQKLQLLRLLFEHYRTIDASFNEAEKKAQAGSTTLAGPTSSRFYYEDVPAVPRSEHGPMSTGDSDHHDHTMSCSSGHNSEPSDMSEAIRESRNLTTRVERVGDIVTVYCGDAQASITLD
ncbi:hypothetical protein F5880DRAFT_752839 [Lentinula raphanica]|nr:hypothetical protein F5880DRAFT_752839 [Lentinula raphanica]